MQNIEEMKAQLEKMKSQVEQKEYVGESGAGLVKVVIAGTGDIKKLSIDPSLLMPSEAETLSDLIIAAFKDAKTKWTEDSAGHMSQLVDKFKDFKLPF